jgi:hypothetical protein
MSDQQPDPPATPPPEAAPPPTPPPGEPPASRHGWAIALGLVGVLALGGMTAAVIDRGSAGGTANTDPSANIFVHETTNVQNTTIAPAAAPPSTVTVKQPSTVTAKQPVTVTVQAPARTTTAPAVTSTTP